MTSLRTAPTSPAGRHGPVLFVDLPTGRPDTGMRVLDEVVNLDAQLARIGAAPG
jgi:hypothetical protein